jgi:hypothetical protein
MSRDPIRSSALIPTVALDQELDLTGIDSIGTLASSAMLCSIWEGREAGWLQTQLEMDSLQE